MSAPNPFLITLVTARGEIFVPNGPRTDEIVLRIPESTLTDPRIRHALTLYLLARIQPDIADPENFVRVPKSLKRLWDLLLS